MTYLHVLILLIQLLVQLFKLDDVSEDVLEDVLGVVRVAGQLGGHAEDLRALPDVVLQVLLSAPR